MLTLTCEVFQRALMIIIRKIYHSSTGSWRTLPFSA